MSRTQRIIDRFPNFYKSWDRTSLISKVVSALGKRLEESEKELVAILRSHWVDTAVRSDLDNLGASYNMKRRPNEPDSDYRDRLKRAIMDFKGGGTISGVLTSVKTVLGLPEEHHLELVENPPKRMYKELEVRTGETRELSSSSVLDAIPSITIGVKTEGSKITNPTITNTETNESITFQGVIESGKQLTIKDRKASLSGVDVTEKLSTTAMPKLLRKGSPWRYTELVEREIGVFDTARFDRSVFEVGIPTAMVAFMWTAHQPATFELRIPREVISEGSLSLVQEVVDSIKAVGVKALVKLTKR